MSWEPTVRQAIALVLFAVWLAIELGLIAETLDAEGTL